MDTPAPSQWKIVFIAFEIILAVNVILVDGWLLYRLFTPQPQIVTMQKAQEQSSTPSAQLGATPTPLPTSTQGTPVPIRVQQVTSGVKEFYVPLGTGQSSATDWDTITGAQAYVNSASYTGIKSVVFEASISIPTVNQNVSVRLFNMTDGHPVWQSDLAFSPQQVTQLLTSAPITLDSGNKLYAVQIKTQLGSPATLNISRVHITIQ